MGIKNIMTNMKIDARMVIVFAVLLLSVILSSCVTKTEITPPPKETTSQPILVTEEHTDRKFTLFVAITKPLPYGYYLDAVLIQPDGDESGGSSGVPAWERSNINITLDGKFEGNNIVMLRNSDNKSQIFYQTNWTVRLPHFKTGEGVQIKSLDITFKPYQIISSSDPNKKGIEIPLEGKNIRFVKEKKVRICIERLKVDKGYFYKPEWLYPYIEFELEPEEKDNRRIIFEIPNNFEPIEMHGHFIEYVTFTSCSGVVMPEDRFVLELK